MKTNFDLQSSQYLLKPILSENALAVAAENNIPTLPTLTYLANTISANNKTVPYSTIVALPTDTREFPTPLAENEIFLNTWTADDLGVKVGDTVTVTYYSVGATKIRHRKGIFSCQGILQLKAFAAEEASSPNFRAFTHR